MEEEFLTYLYKKNVLLYTQYVKILRMYIVWKLTRVMEKKR